MTIAEIWNMPLPLIPIALAGLALWILSDSDKGGGASDASGGFPGGGEVPEDDGSGPETGYSGPGDEGGGEDTSGGGTGRQGPFFEALGASDFRSSIAEAESANGIPQNVLARVLYQESRFNPDAISPDGRDKGIAQVRDDTAADPGYGVPALLDPFNPDEAIAWAGQYLAAMIAQLGLRDGIAAYNGGPGGYTGAAAQRYAATILDDVGLS